MEPGCVPGLTLGGKLKCLEAGDLSVEVLRGDEQDAVPARRGGKGGALLSSSWSSFQIVAMSLSISSSDRSLLLAPRVLLDSTGFLFAGSEL